MNLRVFFTPLALVALYACDTSRPSEPGDVGPTFEVANVPVSAARISFSTVVAGSFGPFAGTFTPGEVAIVSYELDPSVPDRNPAPNAGFYFNATLALTFEFPDRGLTIDFAQGNVQTFDNTANPDDQVSIIGSVNQNNSMLGGETITNTELAAISQGDVAEQRHGPDYGRLWLQRYTSQCRVVRNQRAAAGHRSTTGYHHRH